MRRLRALICGEKHERAARLMGATAVAGVDEVGRGSLFGPVVAAAVILPEKTRIRGVRDSKQLLPEERERLEVIIRKKAIAVAIGFADAATVDAINIRRASHHGHAIGNCATASATGFSADRCRAPGYALLAKGDHLWRLHQHFDRRRLDRCQGVPRCVDVPLSRGISAVRPGFAQGLRYGAAFASTRRTRTVSAASHHV